MPFVKATPEMLRAMTEWGLYPHLIDSDTIIGEPKGVTYKMYQRDEKTGTLHGIDIDTYLERCCIWGIEPYEDENILKPCSIGMNPTSVLSNMKPTDFNK